MYLLLQILTTQETSSCHIIHTTVLNFTGGEEFRLKAPVTQSRFRQRFTTIHHDLGQMVKLGCIRMRRDWGERKSSINTMSHDAFTVAARFIYGSTMTHDGSATIHHGGATNVQECLRCNHDSIFLAWFKTVALRWRHGLPQMCTI